MKHKRLITIFVIVIFALISLFTVFSVYTIDFVNVKFNISDGCKNTADIIDDVLLKWKGKNLLFVDKEDIVDELKDYTYFEVVSVKKDYPNVLNVEISERKERYIIKYDGEYFIVATDGFVLKKATTGNSSLIELNVDSVKIGNKFNFNNVTVGKYISSTDDNSIKALFDIMNVEGISDFVTKIDIYWTADDDPSTTDKNEANQALSIKTSTEVSVLIDKFKEFSIEKANALVKSYENIDDYLKANSFLEVIRSDESGKIEVAWTQKN